MEAAAKLLPRLDKVKEQPRARYFRSWKACCPAHADNDPSLSIDQKDDGRLLLKCWSGCSSVDIVTAVGLELSDLMPPRDIDNYPPMFRNRPRRQHGVSQDAMFLEVCKGARARGEQLTATDKAKEREVFLRMKKGNAA